MNKTLVAVIIASCLQVCKADVLLAPSNSHWGTGVGLVVSEFPISMSKLTIGLSQVYYEYQFTDPTNKVRTSLEGGLYGFYMLLPVPEVAANMYFGSEESDVQGKLGVGGFYDISVGGHAGIMAKAGAVIKNKFDLTFFVVPTGLDAKRSYGEFMQMESKERAEQNYIRNGDQYVIMPYYGMLFSIRY